MHDLNLLNSDISDISLFETLSLRIGVSFNILDSLLSTDQRLMNMTSRTAIDFAICQELGKILLLTDLARCPRDQP